MSGFAALDSIEPGGIDICLLENMNLDVQSSMITGDFVVLGIRIPSVWFPKLVLMSCNTKKSHQPSVFVRPNFLDPGVTESAPASSNPQKP